MCKSFYPRHSKKPHAARAIPLSQKRRDDSFALSSGHSCLGAAAVHEPTSTSSERLGRQHYTDGFAVPASSRRRRRRGWR